MMKVWYVAGADNDIPIPVLFETKLAAEMYARQVWPDASPQDRYARVFYKSVWTEVETRRTIDKMAHKKANETV
jgi:hypothetical protein